MLCCRHIAHHEYDSRRIQPTQRWIYDTCPNFRIIFQDAKWNDYDLVDFVVWDCYLFKGTWILYVLALLKGFLIWELHASGLAGHFGKDNTIALALDRFYWILVQQDFAWIISQCHTCQTAKTTNQNLRLYTQLSIPYMS